MQRPGSVMNNVSDSDTEKECDILPLLKRRSKQQQSLWAYYLSSNGEVPQGYSRLVDAPEVSACINRIAAIISNATIYLMENTKKGDTRVTDGLSRFVDINPWPGVATRNLWMNWIVSTMLGDGDGNAFVLPQVEEGEFSCLEPMPGASSSPVGDDRMYRVSWHGENYDPTEVLHFRLFADPQYPWKGRGYRVQAKRLAEALETSSAVKESLSSPRYKPPLAIFVNTENDLSDETKRETFRKKYLEDTGDGKPWILPADLVKIEQIKPLSLTDLAIKDTVELDKKTVASIFGVPPFLLGIGTYNEKEFNSFIRTVVVPICNGIEQELTLKLLESPKRYFKFNRRRLYDYDLKTLIDIDNSMADRGYLNGDEVREDADRSPAGLTQYKVLENYIPYDMSGKQNKLTDKKEEPNA